MDVFEFTSDQAIVWNVDSNVERLLPGSEDYLVNDIEKSSGDQKFVFVLSHTALKPFTQRLDERTSWGIHIGKENCLKGSKCETKVFLVQINFRNESLV